MSGVGRRTRGREVFMLRKRGWNLKAYIMFHGTDPKNVSSILRNGFKKSDSDTNMLGEGIYLSRNPAKTETVYGDVTLKVVAYTGKVQLITCQGHEKQKTWQREKRDSAHVPPKCGMVQSEREETCIAEPWQILVLGVSRGYDRLDAATQSMIKPVKESKETESEQNAIDVFKNKISKRVRAK